MRGRAAKTLTDADLRRLLRLTSKSASPLRARAMVLLTVKAGLRAGEVARLMWPMVTTATGGLGSHIELPPSIAKYGSGRRIPMHRDVRAALAALEPNRATRVGPVIRSRRGGPMTPKAVVNWFTALYREAGLEGCSSHSGRRTFVTRAARLIHKAGGSLRDVQQLAGHRSIQTTQGYIDGDADAQRRLMRLL